jgi:hypothetical protein
MYVICAEIFSNLRLLGNRIIVGLIGMNLHNAWLWQMNWLWCRLMFLLLDLLHFANKPLECIHNQDTCTLDDEHVFVDFLPMICDICVVWLSPLYFEMDDLFYFTKSSIFGAIHEKDSFGYIMQALYISWNCNNDYNGTFHISWQRYVYIIISSCWCGVLGSLGQSFGFSNTLLVLILMGWATFMFPLLTLSNYIRKFSNTKMGIHQQVLTSPLFYVPHFHV